MSPEQIFSSLLKNLEALRGFTGSYSEGVADCIKVVEQCRDNEFEDSPESFEAIYIDVTGDRESLTKFISVLNENRFTYQGKSMEYQLILCTVITVWENGAYSLSSTCDAKEKFNLPTDFYKALFRANEIRNQYSN